MIPACAGVAAVGNSALQAADFAVIPANAGIHFAFVSIGRIKMGPACAGMTTVGNSAFQAADFDVIPANAGIHLLCVVRQDHDGFPLARE